MIEFKLLRESQIYSFIDQLARLRIDIFREYPYLYDGDYEHEKLYLQKFIHTPDSIVVVLLDDNKIVGAITGLPLMYEDESIKKPWIEENIDIENIYYFSEILIYQNYRNIGLGRKIFNLAEEAVTDMHHYSTYALATVIRPENHPKRPVDYKELDDFWLNNGYIKRENLVCCLSWKELGENQEKLNSLVFWVKN